MKVSRRAPIDKVPIIMGFSYAGGFISFPDGFSLWILLLGSCVWDFIRIGDYMVYNGDMSGMPPTPVLLELL